MLVLVELGRGAGGGGWLYGMVGVPVVPLKGFLPFCWRLFLFLFCCFQESGRNQPVPYTWVFVRCVGFCIVCRGGGGAGGVPSK